MADASDADASGAGGGGGAAQPAEYIKLKVVGQVL